jgi:hypothetical protein
MAGKEDKEEMMGCGILIVCLAIAFAIFISVLKYWKLI